jgi:hypothetical protein
MKIHYWKRHLLLLVILPLLAIAGSPIAHAQWSALGSGIGSGYIEKVAVSNTGAVYAVGSFTGGVAKWNGSSWSVLGGGVFGTIFCIAVNGNDVYVGGAIGSSHIKKWNGSTWSDVGGGLNNDVFALVVKGGAVYAGGSFTADNLSNPMKRIAKWDGTTWSQVGNGFNDGAVYSFSVRGNDLYAGGDFTRDGTNSVDMRRIAKWDGTTWTQVGGGFDQRTIYVIATSNTQVYVSGSFYSGTEPPLIILSKLKSDESGWENFGGWDPVGDDDVRALAVVGEDLYVGGKFTDIGPTGSKVTVNNIARWRPSDSSWSALGTGLNDICEDIRSAPSGDALYVGGSFTSASGVSNTARIAKWTISGTESFTGSDLTITVQDPNPTNPSVNITKTSNTPDGSLPSGIVKKSMYYWTAIPSPSNLKFKNGRVSAPLSVLGGFSVYTNLRWLKREATGQAWIDIGGRVEYGNLVSEVAFDSLSQFAIGSIIDDPLPVELTEFKLTPKANGVLAEWKTASELDNLGFILSRSEQAGGTYQQIASYLSHSSLKGQGTTASETAYTFGDYSVLQPGQEYYYKLENVDVGGKRNVLETRQVEMPEAYSLSQNYPNPFNPETTIRFTVKAAAKAVLTVYDVLGRQVWTKQIDAKAGVNEYSFNGAALSTGLYFYHLKTNGFDKTMKMMLLK